jgi:transcriptional regulator with XRE-family HTH domain
MTKPVTARPDPAPFGAVLREWRRLRRFSQMTLALEAEISARHLSFLESGRAAPSRSMVLRLANTLDMPRAITNQALRSAGFAPAYPALQPGDPDFAPIRLAIDSTLSNHAPYPAVAIDASWNILAANKPALRLFSDVGAAAATNMIRALIQLADGGAIENWEETATLALMRLRAELAGLGGNAALAALAAELAATPRLAAFDVASLDLNRAVIPTVFRLGVARVSLFSTIAQFGAVQDVEASSWRIELMFPADDDARRFFETRRN